MKNRELVEYSIGLDIGTSSVGYAVVDKNGKLLKKGNHHIWGSDLFDEANTAEDRRGHRSSRRRYNKRRVRVRLLQDLMNDMVLEKDPTFFIRLKNLSFLDKEDKKDRLENKYSMRYRMNYNLFCDDNFNDKDYYRKYPTIYHLRHELCESDEKADPRLIYLALHHIVKYRGNFLNEGQKLQLSASNKKEDLRILLDTLAEINSDSYEILDGNLNNVLEILAGEGSRKYKAERCLNEFNLSSDAKKVIKELLTGLLGNSFNLNNLFALDDMVDDESKDIKLSFSKPTYEEDFAKHEDALDERVEYIDSMHKFYSWIELSKIVGNNENPSISYAMVKKYDDHHYDLKQLKQLLKHDRKKYNEMFEATNKKVVNYYNYSNKNNPTKNDIVDEFYKYIKNVIKEVKKIEYKDDVNFLNNIEDTIVKEIYIKIYNEKYMLKQNSKNNAYVPYQMQEDELIKILDKQGKYYPSLKENKDKILSILTFRIPYYYGPLNGDKSKFGWLKRVEGKQNERILPWNHTEIVDVEESAAEFIKRLTNYCTYLPYEKVMPKKSLTCSMYEVLAEVNKIRVNGKLISIDIKQRIVDELFLKSGKKTITDDALKKWFKKNQIYLNNEDLTIEGYQKENKFSTSLTPWIDFTRIFGKIDDSNYELIENIIEDITIFNEGNIVKQRLKKVYNLDNDKIKKIMKLNYTGWSRLSRKLIDGIRADNRYGSSVSILDVMKESHMALMEIINDKELGFKEIIEKANYSEENENFNYEEINNLAGSPALKRGIWQSIKIVDEIRRYMKHQPKNIYIEFARNEGKKQRTDSRVKKLKAIYKDISNQMDQFEKEAYNNLKKQDDSKALYDRLYLYFTQLGKCAYSGQKLDIDKLHEYEIDHIIPRTLVTDDSLDNRVLVIKKENQRKLDAYVLPLEIRNKMAMFWDKLYKNGLISQTKYYRLNRNEFTNDQVEKFINRQLVETRQITKYVANILNNHYEHTKVLTIRADLSHQFREKYKIYKNRNVNDLHHAHDAYIASIIGRYIQLRFPKLESKYVYGQYIYDVKRKYKQNLKEFDRKENYGFILNSMNYSYFDEDTGELIWDENWLNDYIKCFQYKDVYVTKKLEENNGELFKISIEKNAKNSDNGRTNAKIPVNKERADINKYGGYSGLQSDIVAVERIKNNRIDRRLINLPIIYRNSTLEEKCKYLSEYGIYDKVKILKYIKKNQLVEIDDGLFYVTSATELVNAYQLILDKEATKLVYFMNKALQLNDYADLKNDEDKINELYLNLCNKMIEKYPKYKAKAEKMLDCYDRVIDCDISTKVKIITEMLKITKSGPICGNLKVSPLNMTDREGRLASQAINLDKTTFYDVSITGLYVKKYKL